MRTPRTSQIYLLALLVLTAVSNALAAEFPAESRVLVIYGNPDIGPWEQNFNQIILEDLATHAAIPVIPEFLDLIQSSPADQELIAESLRLKYSRLNINLVIAVLPEANSFVHQWADVFAPRARRLHVIPGLDVSTASDLRESAQIIETSVAQATELTVNLISEILPDTGHIYVIGGSSDGDLSYLQRFKAAIENTERRLDYTIISGRTPDELLAELAEPEPNSAILMSTYDRDHTGEELRTMAVNSMLSENISLPIFSVFDTLVTSGTIGGNVSSSSLYAGTTSRTAIELLAGRVYDGPIKSDTGYLFNGSLLNRFNINRNRLPAGSQIVNDSPNLWRDYSNWIIGGLLIIFAQLALIALLGITMQRRRIAESELKKVHRMEALGSLSGGIAHDFNNILMSIMANAELVNMQPENKPLVRKRVRKILNSSERAKDLIAQILSFSRQSASFDPRPISLNKIVDDAVAQLRSFIPASCTIEFDCQKNLPLINGDASQVEQIITNICVNAEHAMPDGGRILISTSHCQLDKAVPIIVNEVPAGDYVLLSIADNGAGIEEQDLQHVFEPFFTTKPRGKGTGLGLSMVYQMVKGHGGYIDLKSSKNRGTTALLYFPVSSEAMGQEASQLTQPSLQGNGELILIVDDDNMVLDANCENLRALGYQVTAFSSSVEALEYFQQHEQEFDLLLTDLSMPEMDGVRLINNIRQINPGLPAILCTGYLDALQSPELDDLQVIKKPFSMPEISEALHSALKSEAGHRNN